MANRRHVKAQEALRVLLERLALAGLDTDCKVVIQLRGRQVKANVVDCPAVELSVEE